MVPLYAHKGCLPVPQVPGLDRSPPVGALLLPSARWAIPLRAPCDGEVAPCELRVDPQELIRAPGGKAGAEELTPLDLPAAQSVHSLRSQLRPFNWCSLGCGQEGRPAIPLQQFHRTNSKSIAGKRAVTTDVKRSGARRSAGGPALGLLGPGCWNPSWPQSRRRPRRRSPSRARCGCTAGCAGPAPACCAGGR